VVVSGPAGVALDVALLAVSILLLWVGATQLVEGAVRTADRLGVPRVVVGLTVVAIGTSAPEFAVTVEAALIGRPDIAVGNVVGSNLFNLGIILGLVGLFAPFETDRSTVRRDGPILALAVAVLLLLLLDLRLTRLEGIVLLAGFVAYLLLLVRSGVMRPGDVAPEPDAPFRRTDPLRLVGGILLVVASARVLVFSAVDLARLAGVSEWAIAVTVVAAGTSTPELATALVAARRGQVGLSTGNLVGSDVFNVLGVVGVAALLHPVRVAPAATGSVLSVLALVAVAVVALRTGWRLSRREGVLLVAIAVVRWGVELAG
jgi:cation:H+ antiporter